MPGCGMIRPSFYSKTLIPRKGELLKTSASAARLEQEDRSEDRLNKILSEVNKSPDIHQKSILEHPALNPGLLLPGFPGQAPEDIKQALSLYQAELSRQQQQAARQLDTKLDQDKSWDNSKEEKENQDGKPSPGATTPDHLKSPQNNPFTNLLQVYLSVYLSICLFIYLSVYCSIHTYLTLCISVIVLFII